MLNVEDVSNFTGNATRVSQLHSKLGRSGNKAEEDREADDDDDDDYKSDFDEEHMHI